MKENEISKIIIDKAVRIHQRLGPGLLERVYETVLAYELEKAGLSVIRQLPISIKYDDIEFADAFKADIVVEDMVIIEIKSLTAVNKAHKKQLLTYLRLGNKRLGLLLNFGSELMKSGIFRVVNNLEQKETSGHPS